MQAHTDGFNVYELIAAPSMKTSYSCPVNEDENMNILSNIPPLIPLQRSTASKPYVRSEVQSPINKDNESLTDNRSFFP